MNNFLFALAVEPATDAINWGERASVAGTVALLGMVTIFVVLVLLWAVIEIMHRMLVGKMQKNNKEVAPTKVESMVESTVTEAPVAEPSIVADDDGALVAAITAAISACLAEDGYTKGFRVVSFKRASASGRRNRF